LNYGIRIIVAPTVREKNGLALSSRNKYLSPEEHRQAAVLYQSLRQARKLIASGERNADRIAAVMRDLIRERSSARLDYIAVTDAHSLQRVKRLTGEVLISLAARFGRTRLIGNIHRSHLV
jgi:pantoate--beta-alanine ligase